MSPSIIAFGEALLRLTPPNHQRFEQAQSFELEIGGAELNAAVGLARLGHEVAWVSRLPDSPLGRMIAGRVRAAGVDDRFVKYADGRAGIYYLEEGAAPRPASILYDRADSSMARVRPGEFVWPSIFQDAKWFHVTGITPALSESAAATVAEAMTAAKAAGLTVSVDLNYRAKLWTPQRAGQVMTDLLQSCNILFASEADAALLFGITGNNFEEVASQLSARFSLQCVASMRREAQLLWRDRVQGVGFSHGQFFESKSHEVEVVDRLGTGDAFASGVIHGLMLNDMQLALEAGSALGALAHTIRGDLPLVTPDDVESAISGSGLRIRR